MNRNKLLNVWAVVITVYITLFTLLLSGCATSGFTQRNMAVVSRYFEMDADTVWNAVIQAVEGIPIDTVDKDRGTLRTKWVKGWSSRKTTGLLLEGRWQERYRLFIRVLDEQDRTYVSISTLMEEKAPGGSQAYRWSRVASDGTIERDFLKKLESIINSQGF